jgi:hypothetical protein
MHTFNHPSLMVMYEYVKHIGLILSIGKPSGLNLLALSHYKAFNNSIHVCSHHLCLQALGCRYAPSSIFRGGYLVEANGHLTVDYSRHAYMDINQLCHQFYRLYDGIDLRSASERTVSFY